ncbi:MAG: hypothetical protein AAGH83_09835 [Pseudomonadota bacterium]
MRFEAREDFDFANAYAGSEFAGFKLSLQGLKDDRKLDLLGARVVEYTNTAGLRNKHLEVKNDNLFVDLQDLDMEKGDGFELRVDLKYTGDRNIDVFSGSIGDDRIFGKGDDDVLFGDRGKDRIFGGYADDFIDGGAGEDKLSGGTGADTFVFAQHKARDTITDFDVDEDVLMVMGPETQIGHLQMKNKKKGVLITSEAGEVQLTDVRKENLDASNFAFDQYPAPAGFLHSSGSVVTFSAMPNFASLPYPDDYPI